MENQYPGKKKIERNLKNKHIVIKCENTVHQLFKTFSLHFGNTALKAGTWKDLSELEVT